MSASSPYIAFLEEELKGFISSETGELAQTMSRLLSCPVCHQQHEAMQELFVKRSYRFMLCQDCGLIFANPQILPELNRQLYDSARSLKEAARYIKDDAQLSFDTELYQNVLKLVGERGKARLRCLDISMRAGLAAELPLLSSYDVDTLDFCRFTRELGQNRHPEKKFFNCFEPIVASEAKYDLVISMEAVEQFQDPAWFMRNVSMVLNEGGTVCGVLSNTESLLVRLLGKDAPLFDGLYQKFFFNTGSLRRLFEATGFSEVVFNTILPCTERIHAYLNRLLPLDRSIDSSSSISELCRYAEKNLLGYKLLFAASKKGS